MTKEKLKAILELHLKYLNGLPRGKRAKIK